jgi:hypothetical protein
MLARLLLAAAAFAPFAAQEDAPAGARRNPILEGVAVQAGDAVVLLSEYERQLERAIERRPPNDRGEELYLREQLCRELAIARLEEQRGADLGLDPELVERIKRSSLADRRREKGIEGYLAAREEQGTDALTEEAEHEQGIYREIWQYKMRGQAFGATRQTRDQGVRPGELREFYEENRDKLAPPMVQLRWLIVTSRAAGSPEAARETCEDARRRALAGEDFALLVEELGTELRDSRGLTQFFPPAEFRDRTLVPFCEQAEEGDLSEVLPLVHPQSGEPDPRLGYQVAELHERQVPPVPEFAEREVQRLLSDVLVRRRNQLAVARARETLWREDESCWWVNPLLLPPAPPAGPPRAP